MSIDNDCPNGCGNLLADDAVCCNRCGWAAAPGRTLKSTHPQPCEHVDRGQRCAQPGSMCPNTTGRQDANGKWVSGPWYCPSHLPTMATRNDDLATPPPAGLFAALRRRLARPRFDSEAAVERAAIQSEANSVHSR